MLQLPLEHYNLKKEKKISLGDINISGSTIFDKGEIEKLIYNQGDFFEEKIIDRIVKKILMYYSNRGFPFASLEIENLEIEDNKVNFDIIILPGNLQRINEFIIKGNTFTDEQFIINLFNIEENEIFRESKLKEEIKRINEKQFINIEDYYLINLDGDNRLSIVLEVFERSEGKIWGLLSYSRDKSLSFLLKISNKNLFGRGRSLYLSLIKEGKLYREEKLNYTEPSIFSLPINFCLEAEHRLFNEDNSYTSIYGGIEFLKSNYSLTAGPGMEYYSGENVDEDSYPYLDSRIEIRNEPVSLNYRQKWKENRGWDIEVSVILDLWNLIIENEYFKKSNITSELKYFSGLRGYTGFSVKEAYRLGGEINFGLGRLIYYPLFDAGFLNNEWWFSYGLGIKAGKIKLEYAIPAGEYLSEGRIYIIFDSD